MKKVKIEKTHIELCGVTLPHRLALIVKLIKKQKPLQPKLPHKRRQAHKRQRRQAAQRQLHDAVVRPLVHAVAEGACKDEMRHRRNDDRENNENAPREAQPADVGLVDAHPPEIGPEALQLVVGV